MAFSSSENISSSEEPVTPAGRLFLRPEMNTLIHCLFGFQHHIDIDSIKSTIKNSLFLKHPRFCSLLVYKNGVQKWKRTEVNINQHIIVENSIKPHENSCNSEDRDDVVIEKEVNEYISDLSVSSPLSYDKPLWEIHILLEQRCAVLRVHHALGDGISLMSMLLASCRKAEDPEAMPSIPVNGRRDERRRLDWKRVVARFFVMIWLNLLFCVEFVLRSLWVRDRNTVISGGSGVELWPRKIATAKFLLDDMKVVKKAVDNATINDVLFGLITSGLSKYLDHRTPNALRDGDQITGVAMVNLRQQPGLQELSELMKSSNSGSRWGNKFGMLLLPIFYQKHAVDPLEYVKKTRKTIDRKKQTLEAHFSYAIGRLIMSLLGSKVAYLLNYRIICNTTFTISNVVGPKEEITIAGNPITFLRVNTSSIPHALTMHMLSYAGKAEMQIMVAKDIIPDPEFLAKCFEDALLEMKEAAKSREHQIRS